MKFIDTALITDYIYIIEYRPDLFVTEAYLKACIGFVKP